MKQLMWMSAVMVSIMASAFTLVPCGKFGLVRSTAADLAITNAEEFEQKLQSFVQSADKSKPVGVEESAQGSVRQQAAQAAVAQQFKLPLVSAQLAGKVKAQERYLAEQYAHPITNTCLIPRAKLEKDGYDWWQRHEKVLKVQKELNPEIVFVGDSITHFWAGTLSVGEKGADTKERWTSKFGKWRVLNLGYGWDRIQNVLWRLEHGEMQGLNPKKIVVHIGTNNVGGTKQMEAASAEEIAEGTLALVKKLEAMAPNAKIILMAIFPRGEQAGGHWRKVCAASNARLKQLVAGDKRVVYLDIGEKFLDAQGNIPKTLMGDFCHPTTEGYEIWANAILPYLAE